MTLSHHVARQTDAGNSIDAPYLRHMTDSQIRAAITSNPEGMAALVSRAFPGSSTCDARTLAEALAIAGANFTVEKRPLAAFPTDPESALVNIAKAVQSGDASKMSEAIGTATPIATHVANIRTDTCAPVGIVGADYGVVQTSDAMASAAILADRGDVKLAVAQVVDGGARVRVSGLLDAYTFESLSGAPNTLANFVIWEATHDGSACTTAAIYTLRLECFNGMTSRDMIQSHRLRHTSCAANRVEAMTQGILQTLIGDAEAEREIFQRLVMVKMERVEFETFATTLLGGELTDDCTPSKRTRREKDMEELCNYFEGGNQGAGPTAWGAYNSVTRWVEAKREAMTDAAKNARKFESNLTGEGQRKVSRALRLLS